MANIAERVAAITRNEAYASQLTAMITELNLTDDEARDYFKIITLDFDSDDLSFIKCLVEIMKYKGNPRRTRIQFDHKKLIAILLKKHGDKARSIQSNPGVLKQVIASVKVEDRVKESIFTNNMPFVQDMKFICLMFLLLPKISRAMIDVMALMKNKYGINMIKRRPGQSLPAEIITIPRIAACFPAVVVGLFDEGFGEIIFDPKTLFPEGTIPRVIYAPMVTSVLPNVADLPIVVFLAIAVKTDDILHQTDAKTSLSALYQYLTASINSTVVSNDFKVKYTESWKIGTRVNGIFTYNPTIVGLKETAKAFIRTSRANDSQLDVLLAKM